jgi:hypothetical protein
MAKQFLHIAFKFADRNPRIEQLKSQFDKAIDWYRYAPNCWIVWTSSTPEKWYERLKPYVRDDDYMLIVGLNIEERQGWMGEDFWEWIEKKRTS